MRAIDGSFLSTRFKLTEGIGLLKMEALSTKLPIGGELPRGQTWAPRGHVIGRSDELTVKSALLRGEAGKRKGASKKGM